MDNSHDVEVTNDLIATTLDSMKGYSQSAEQTENSEHARFFEEMAQERSRVASELQDHVRSLGSEPETESSISGATHRGWVKIKDAITSRNDKTVVEEVERGEDYIRDQFQSALDDDQLSPQTRGVLEKCFASIRKGHDRASALKHAIA